MISKTFDGQTLILVLENGVDAKGNPLYLKKSYKYFSEAATPEEIHEVGSKLAVLFSNQLSSICVDEGYVLTV